jgi:predicted metal-dependent TIM-barrel fold hydrolase
MSSALGWKSNTKRKLERKQTLKEPARRYIMPDNDAMSVIETMIADPEYATYFTVNPATLTREDMLKLVEKERARRALYMEESE